MGDIDEMKSNIRGIGWAGHQDLQSIDLGRSEKEGLLKGFDLCGRSCKGREAGEWICRRDGRSHRGNHGRGHRGIENCSKGQKNKGLGHGVGVLSGHLEDVYYPGGVLFDD